MNVIILNIYFTYGTNFAKICRHNEFIHNTQINACKQIFLEEILET